MVLNSLMTPSLIIKVNNASSVEKELIGIHKTRLLKRNIGQISTETISTCSEDKQAQICFSQELVESHRGIRSDILQEAKEAMNEKMVSLSIFA
jgi:hypothetical protein